MTHQPNLFDATTATVRSRQPDLFERSAVESDLHCSQCGRALVETESGYLCCPDGHGRLVADTVTAGGCRAEDGEECDCSECQERRWESDQRPARWVGSEESQR